MNYVYYISENKWHGAAHYYEYPCVFVWVLINEYIGIRYCLDADLLIAAKLKWYGSIQLDSEAYSISYEYKEKSFNLKNLIGKNRRLKLDLSAIYPIVEVWNIKSSLGDYTARVNDIIEENLNNEKNKFDKQISS